jgi:hypothetical protein
MRRRTLSVTRNPFKLERRGRLKVGCIGATMAWGGE